MRRRRRVERTYLDGLSEVVSPSLLLNHPLVDLSGGQIVVLGERHVEVSLVVSDVCETRAFVSVLESPRGNSRALGREDVPKV
jgi:hypothetical protein